jgi:hypothetical protein
MKEMTAYHSDTDLDVILSMVKECTGERVAKNLQLFVSQNKIKLELTSADLESKCRNGTLLVHFAQPMSTADVNNYVVSGTHVNEMSFEDNKTLRLW